ncbi:MAG: hypothetical protein WCX61_00345 [Candidatus Peribacteraceae bacterium]|jgi:membrane-bound ClpP family serine protease
MKNSEEFLSQEIRSKLKPEQIEIIDGIQHGSRITLKEKVQDAAMRMYEANEQKKDSAVPWYKKLWEVITQPIYLIAAIVTILAFLGLSWF